MSESYNSESYSQSRASHDRYKYTYKKKDTYTHINTKIHIYIYKYKKYTNLTGEHISSLDITFNGLQLAPICSLRHYSSPNINPSNISSKVHNQQLRYKYNDSIDRAVTGREVGSG